MNAFKHQFRTVICAYPTFLNSWGGNVGNVGHLPHVCALPSIEGTQMWGVGSPAQTHEFRIMPNVGLREERRHEI